MEVIKHRKIYLTISIILFLTSLFVLMFWGLKFGIDFTGGSLIEVNFIEERMSNQEIQEKLASLNLGEINIQPTGDKGVILRMKDIDEKTHQGILTKLNNHQEERFESIGPLIGKELKNKAIWAIGLSLLVIILYIAWAFRKVYKPVASWQYGLVAIVALFHDIFITLGFFAFLGYFKEVEIGLPFVAAFLTKSCLSI